MLKWQVPDTKETQAVVNGCTVNVYPAQHSQAIRGVEKCSVAWSDEAGSYPIGQAREVRAIFEGFIPKSNPVIAFTGTPGHINDLLHNMMDESEEDTIYQRIKQDYTHSKLYSEQDIIRAKRSKSWGREMMLSYGIGTGTCFNSSHIDRCIIYNPQPLDISSSVISVGIDPAFSGSADGSKFAISAVTVNPTNGKARVLVSKQFSGLSNSESINLVHTTLTHLGFTPAEKARFRVFVDSANPGTISDIKPFFSESPYWQDINYLKEYAQKQGMRLSDCMLVCPVYRRSICTSDRSAATIVDNSASSYMMFSVRNLYATISFIYYFCTYFPLHFPSFAVWYSNLEIHLDVQVQSYQ